MGQPQQLMKLGPFKSIDTTSAESYVADGVGISGTSVNMHREPLSLTAERGRTNIATIASNADVTFIGPYVPTSLDTQMYGASTSGRFVYDFATGTQKSLTYNGSLDTSLPDQSIQIGNVLYDNAGRQYSALSPNATYDWQYQPFTAAGSGSGVTFAGASNTPISVSRSTTPITANASAFYGVTLQFSFTRLTFGPNSSFAQESSAASLAQGTNGALFPAYATYTFPASSGSTVLTTPGGYTAGSTTVIVASTTGIGIGTVLAISGDANTPTVTAINLTTLTISAGGFASNHAAGTVITFTATTLYYPQISGTFTGLNDDGSTYVTNMYVSSNVVATFYFAATLTGTAPYTSPYVVAMMSPSDFIANAQLIPIRDAPPVTPTNVGAIAYHKGAAWCLVVAPATISPNQNATSTPQSITIQQMQLWWSKYGIPWEFDKTDNVNVLDANVPSNVPPYGGTYGEQPISLVSLSSVLLAWTTQNTYVTYGDGTTQSPYVSRKLFNIGSRARHSHAVCILDQVGSVACWLSENGVQMTDGQYAYRIDEPIRHTIESLSLSDRTNCVGFFAHRAYYLSFPQANVTYAYYLPTGDWFGPLPYATSAAYAVQANPATQLSTSGAMNQVAAVRGLSAIIDSWFTGADLDLGVSQTATWVSPESTCGEPRAQKSVFRVSVNAPVQPGIFVRVTLNTEQGVWSSNIDLSKGPTTVTTVGNQNGDGPLIGFLVQCTVALTTSASYTGTAQVWDVSVDGSFMEIAAFDNTAAT